MQVLPFAKPLINAIFLHESKSQAIQNSALQEMQEDCHSFIQWLSSLSPSSWIVLQKDTFCIYTIFCILAKYSLLATLAHKTLS